jgi:serine protease
MAVQQVAKEPEPTAGQLPLRLSANRAEAIAEAVERQLGYVPGEVLVRFKDGVTTTGQARALAGLRSRPLPSRLRWSGPVALLRDESEPNAFILASQLRFQPEVLYAEPNYLRYTQSTPSDPSFATRQWNLTSLNMQGAWDIQPAAGRDVIVAVIDTGLTTSAQTLVFPTWNGTEVVAAPVPFAASPDMGASRFVPGRDFIFFDGTPVLDMDGHGTHVAGTIAQEANNGIAGAGLAYNAKIMGLKACVGYWELQFVKSASGSPGYLPLSETGFCDVQSTAEAIRYAADNGAKVINLSLSGPSATQTERDAITYAVGKGVFIAAAMGNHFESGNATHYPAGFAADIQGFVSVGATGRSQRRSYYSATGGHIELVAPGGDLRDNPSQGGIYQVTVRSTDFDPATVIFPRFDRFSEEVLQGTSMATPHVAGAAALLVAQGITRPADIERALTRTARDLGTSGKDDEFGYGLIQPRMALFGLGIRR